MPAVDEGDKPLHPRFHKPKPKPKPKPAPTPAPEPRSRWTNPPWNGLVLYVCWAMPSGQYTPQQIAQIADRMGAHAVSVEITAENDPYQQQAAIELRQRGIHYGIWERADVGPMPNAVEKYSPDFYEADIEGPMSDPDWQQRFDTTHDMLPRRLLATGALDQAYPGGAPVAEKPWLANWDLAMQDYLVHNTNPDAAENFAFWRNFPINASGHRHWPVLEINAEGSQPLAPQLPLVAAWGRAYGVYTVEYLTDDDINAAAA